MNFDILEIISAFFVFSVIEAAMIILVLKIKNAKRRKEKRRAIEIRDEIESIVREEVIAFKFNVFAYRRQIKLLTRSVERLQKRLDEKENTGN